MSKYIFIGLFFTSLLCWGEDLPSFSSRVDEKANRIFDAENIVNKGMIYSSCEASKSILKVQSEGLFQSALDFVAFLESARSEYESLDIDVWGEATNALLSVSKAQSSKVAWGNFIVKGYINDYIARSIYVRAKNTNVLDSVSEYRGVVNKLRPLQPSELAAIYIAKKCHDIPYHFVPKKLDYTGIADEVSLIGERIHKEKKMHRSVGGPDENTMLKIFQDEQAGNYESYKDLLEKEPVWMMAQRAIYKKMLWDLDMFLCVKSYSSQHNIGISAIANDKFPHFIQECAKGVDPIWFSEDFSEYLINPKLDPYGYKRKLQRSGGAGSLDVIWGGGRVNLFPHGLN